MISFYPGPSRLYPQVRGYLADAYDSGLLSMNHRSAEFVALSERCIGLLKQKLSIPEDYTVFYTSSATECWEIIAQSLIAGECLHAFNGAFGEKWFEYTQKLVSHTCHSFEYPVNELPQPEQFPRLHSFNDFFQPVVCLTQNETSNATQLHNEVLALFRRHYAHALIAVDATSSLGGIALDWQQADVWLASVQKCLGLPAGMALMICSPAAVAQALRIGENRHYNSFVFLYEKMQNRQTTYTPNVLNIYLLMRVMEQVNPIAQVDALVRSRAQQWYEFLDQKGMHLLISNPDVRSDTVIAVSGEAAWIQWVKSRARAAGLLPGNGYGRWKDTTFRIANFPAMEETEIGKFRDFLGTL